VRTEEPNNLAWGDGVTSRLRMSRRIRMFELVPTSKWLFRLDCIYNNRGSTGLHSHPGSGIRCMLKGHLRVESDKGESSDNRLTGDCWYEEGSYPLISTSDPGESADFLRGMVLPPEYARYPIPPYGSRRETLRVRLEKLRPNGRTPCCERSPGDVEHNPEVEEG
jgi:hypothetical protein